MQTHTAAPTDLGGGNPAFSDKIQREYFSGAAAAPRTMSVGGVAVKTIVLLIVLVAAGAWGWASATEPVADAMIEIWQADAQGRHAHPADARGSNATFRGFGRSGTGRDPRARFIFDTVKPGASEAGTAPHINVIVFMRGLLAHVYTRIYFEDEAAANALDPVLASVPQERRGTLLARRRETPAGAVYDFDIRMQGDRETVFFDL